MIAAKENFALEELAQELDSDFGSIACKVITLNDLKTTIANLRIEMDNMDEQHARVYFRDIHRSVRLIDDLIHYTVRSLNVEFKEAEDTKELMFQKIVKGL